MKKTNAKKIVPVNTPLFVGKEKQYLNECIDTGWVSSDGSFVGKFEQDFADYVGVKHGISVCNGSVAIDLAIASLELEEGDEIIMPTFTIISCIAAVIRKGLIPILVDCSSTTFNMTASDIEKKITKRTKAIMVVHIYGLPVDVNPILELSKKHNLKIIEDSAEMHGQTYYDKKCGSLGDISTFSFYANKHITTGEGGMVLTNSDTLAEKCRYYRNLCFNSESRFVHDDLGWNFRMSNIQAAVGCAQLETIETFISRKRTIGSKYNEAFKEYEDIFQLPIKSTDYASNIYWVYSLLLKPNSNIDLKDFSNLLSERGIGNRPFFWPMHLQPYLLSKGMFVNEHYPNAEYISSNGLYIPSGLGMTNDDIDYVSGEISKIVKRY